jgi:hypothetical protein
MTRTYLQQTDHNAIKLPVVADSSALVFVFMIHGGTMNEVGRPKFVGERRDNRYQVTFQANDVLLIPSEMEMPGLTINLVDPTNPHVAGVI